MPSASEVFVNCDELGQLPARNRDNYLFELTWLTEHVPAGDHVLQVGSMDGMRALRILQVRPDLRLTGLELEPELVLRAQRNLQSVTVPPEFIVGDITQPPAGLSTYSHVVCLNNTLGYIPDVDTALHQMRSLGRTIVVSVYGETFDERLAEKYFDAIGLEVREQTPEAVVLRDFSAVRRFPRSVVESWSPTAITETPIGYLAVLAGVESE